MWHELCVQCKDARIYIYILYLYTYTCNYIYLYMCLCVYIYIWNSPWKSSLRTGFIHSLSLSFSPSLHRLQTVWGPLPRVSKLGDGLVVMMFFAIYHASAFLVVAFFCSIATIRTAISLSSIWLLSNVIKNHHHCQSWWYHFTCFFMWCGFNKVIPSCSNTIVMWCAGKNMMEGPGVDPCWSLPRETPGIF